MIETFTFIMKITATNHGVIDHAHKIEVIVEHCCQKMEKAWDKNFITFGKHENSEIIDQINPEVNSKTRPSIYSLDSFSDEWMTMTISYCPFCAKKIRCEYIE